MREFAMILSHQKENISQENQAWNWSMRPTTGSFRAIQIPDRTRWSRESRHSWLPRRENFYGLQG